MVVKPCREARRCGRVEVVGFERVAAVKSGVRYVGQRVENIEFFQRKAIRAGAVAHILYSVGNDERLHIRAVHCAAGKAEHRLTAIALREAERFVVTVVAGDKPALQRIVALKAEGSLVGLLCPNAVEVDNAVCLDERLAAEIERLAAAVGLGVVADEGIAVTLEIVHAGQRVGVEVVFQRELLLVYVLAGVCHRAAVGMVADNGKVVALEVGIKPCVRGKRKGVVGIVAYIRAAVGQIAADAPAHEILALRAAGVCRDRGALGIIAVLALRPCIALRTVVNDVKDIFLWLGSAECNGAAALQGEHERQQQDDKTLFHSG